MLKKFEVNLPKIKGVCQSDAKAAPQESWSDLILLPYYSQKILMNLLIWPISFFLSLMFLNDLSLDVVIWKNPISVPI